MTRPSWRRTSTRWPGSSPAAVSRLSASWSTCTGSPMRRTTTVGALGQRDLGQALDADPELLVRHLAQLVQPGDRVAVGRLAVVADHGEDLALDPLGHDVLPAARLLVDVLPLQPDDVDEQALGEAVLAHDAGGDQPALVGELEVAVAREGEQAVALHAGHGLRHRRARVAQALGDPGAQGDDPLLHELVDRAQVHLGGVDQVRHTA